MRRSTTGGYAGAGNIAITGGSWDPGRLVPNDPDHGVDRLDGHRELQHGARRAANRSGAVAR